jgi:hypothetical protein
MTLCTATAVDTGKRCKLPGKYDGACHNHRQREGGADAVPVALGVLTERRAEAARRAAAAREQEEAYRALASRARPVEGAHGRRLPSVAVQDGGAR